MQLRILLPAEQELAHAAAYYEARSSGLGHDFLKKVESAFRELALFPNRWPVYADGIRRRPIHRFPYSILYRLDPEVVVILAVVHQKRRPDYWSDRT